MKNQYRYIFTTQKGKVNLVANNFAEAMQRFHEASGETSVKRIDITQTVSA
jgi:hypothetical protein